MSSSSAGRGHRWPGFTPGPAKTSGTLVAAAGSLGGTSGLTVNGATLDAAVRGGLLPAGTFGGDAAAAIDGDGGLVGILGRLDDGSVRLRPNFRGLG